MYESFFQLDERPFNSVPLAHRYYPAPAIEDARCRLTRCIERAEGPGLLIGPVGTGKSLLLDVLAKQFGDTLAIVQLSGGHLCTRHALLQAILFELGLPYRNLQESELRLSLIDHLAHDGTCPSGMLLLVDEAHAVGPAMLDDLRMMSDLVRDGRPSVRLVLAGSSVLEESFADPKLESFNQRLAVRSYLESFDHHDSIQYVRAQIAASGGEADQIFTAEALDAVHRATEGTARLINQLCDHALMMACAGGASQLLPSHVDEAWADLQQLPAPWSGSEPSAEAQGDTDVVEFGALDDEAASTGLADEPENREAVPFPAAAGVDVGDEPDTMLDAVTERSGEGDEPFEPAGSIGPKVEPVFGDANDPFAESFDEEEEVVVDQIASPEQRPAPARQSFGRFEGPAITDALGRDVERNNKTVVFSPVIADRPAMAPTRDHDPVMPEEEFSMPPEQMSAIRVAPRDDLDVVMPEDDDLVVEEEAATRTAMPIIVPHQNYRQLFAKLRRG